MLLSGTALVNVSAKGNQVVNSSSTQSVKSSPKQDSSKLSIEIPELKDGEKVKVPLKAISDVTSRAIGTDVSDAGYVVFSRSGGDIFYRIVITELYTTLSCTASTTDITSGKLIGFERIIAPMGTISTSPLKGHVNVLTLSGTAFLLNKPVVSIYAQAKYTG